MKGRLMKRTVVVYAMLLVAGMALLLTGCSSTDTTSQSALQLAENTLVIFTSDNGSYMYRLDDPQVVEMRRRYRERDTGSLVDEMVAERVAEGKMPDPAQFTLEAVCGRPDPSREPASTSAEHSPTSC